MKSFKSYVFCSLIFSLFVASASADVERRQITVLPTTAPATTTTDRQPTTTATTSTDRSTTSTSSSSSTPTTSATSRIATTPTDTPPAATYTTRAPSTTTPAQVSLTSVSGSEVTVTLTGGPAPSISVSTSAPSAAPPSSDSGLGTGSIIGLSVAGGVALLGVIAFFIWKFTRKHNSDFDDNEAIKWPDLNNHGTGNTDSHPLPVKNTGRAGFDTGSEADLSLSHNPNYSTPDFNPNTGIDPYAVPPLPHLNPNQPYRDDPTSITGYYDPYRGPVPGSLEPGAPPAAEWGSEAIPMTQMGMNTGRMSPAPSHLAYGAVPPQTTYDTGRRSPGPYAAYSVAGQQPGGRMSPGPQLAYHAGAMSS